MLARTRFGQQAGERRGKSFSELKLPEYLALNPMGTSPAFQDGLIIHIRSQEQFSLIF
jgi:hypothetical protein